MVFLICIIKHLQYVLKNCLTCCCYCCYYYYYGCKMYYLRIKTSPMNFLVLSSLRATAQMFEVGKLRPRGAGYLPGVPRTSPSFSLSSYPGPRSRRPTRKRWQNFPSWPATGPPWGEWAIGGVGVPEVVGPWGHPEPSLGWTSFRRCVV